jgi:hypothetical protein
MIEKIRSELPAKEKRRFRVQRRKKNETDHTVAYSYGKAATSRTCMLLCMS